MQGKYETDALEDFMTYESKKFDKVGKFTLKMRNLKTNIPHIEIQVSNPECGEP
jgi:hypothetical protein